MVGANPSDADQPDTDGMVEGPLVTNRIRVLDPYGLRAALVESAKAAARSKGTYFSAQYGRLKGRRGPAKATIAVAHSLLVVAYHVLQRNEPYHDLGADYCLNRESPDHHAKRLVRQLERLGYGVDLRPVDQIA
jgi:transposase